MITIKTNEDLKKMREAGRIVALTHEELKKHINVETGVFGADMIVNIKNDGPCTILLERWLCLKIK